MKKKGFTLIELLAVIVILAVIALIATPLIMNVINDARKNSFKDSAYGIVKAVEFRAAKEQMDHPDKQNKDYKVNVLSDAITYSGDKPTSGWAHIDQNGNIELYMCNDAYCARKGLTEKEVTVTSDPNEMDTIKAEITRVSELDVADLTGNDSEVDSSHITYIPALSNETHKGTVYLDPTDLSKECSPAESASSTGTKKGCMKWYVIDDSTSEVKLLLDHNTTPFAMWNSLNSNQSMGTTQYEIKAGLEGLTKPSTELVFGDTASYAEYGSEWKVTPALPTVDEIAQIANIPGFDSSSTSQTSSYFGVNSSSDTSKRASYAWLYDYTSFCLNNGCDTEDNEYYFVFHDTNGGAHKQPFFGYWTSTPQSGSENKVWSVSSGSVALNDASSYGFGVRPVIKISKALLKTVSAKGYTYVAAPSGETYKGILYLDPTNLNATCSAELAAANKQGKDSNGTTTLTGTKTGCMRWFAFGDDGNGNPNTAILDHNTTAIAIYDFEGKNGTSGNERTSSTFEADWQLGIDVINWDSSLQARFPTTQDIVVASNAESWRDGAYFGGSAETRGNYWWLFTNLYDVESMGGQGNDNASYNYYSDSRATISSNTVIAYWTSTPSSIYGTPAMHSVIRYGHMNSGVAGPAGNATGVRPIISLSSLDLK